MVPLLFQVLHKTPKGSLSAGGSGYFILFFNIYLVVAGLGCKI